MLTAEPQDYHGESQPRNCQHRLRHVWPTVFWGIVIWGWPLIWHISVPCCLMDVIWVMMIVWRIRSSELHCTVNCGPHLCTTVHAHTHTHSWAVLRDDRWFRFEFHFCMFFAFFFTEPVSCCWLSLVDSPSAIECWQRIISGNYLYVE